MKINKRPSLINYEWRLTNTAIFSIKYEYAKVSFDKFAEVNFTKRNCNVITQRD